MGWASASKPKFKNIINSERAPSQSQLSITRVLVFILRRRLFLEAEEYTLDSLGGLILG